jgi:hypothetical protein
VRLTREELARNRLEWPAVAVDAGFDGPPGPVTCQNYSESSEDPPPVMSPRGLTGAEDSRSWWRQTVPSNVTANANRTSVDVYYRVPADWNADQDVEVRLFTRLTASRRRSTRSRLKKSSVVSANSYA